MSYRALVRLARPAFFPLGFLARLPYATTPLATLILLQAGTGSYAFAGLAGATQSIATAVSGPVIGLLADRFGHRRIGLITAAASIVSLLALIAADHPAHPDRTALAVAATLTGLATPQVGAVIRARWSHLAHDAGQAGLLPTAMSYEAAADDTSFVAGPALVGLLTPLGPITPIVATIGLLAFATVPFALRHSGGPLPHPAGTAPREPLPVLPLLALCAGMAAMGAIFGAVQTGVTVYANGTGQPGVSGLIYAEFGIGSALAGIVCGWLPHRFTLGRRHVVFAATLLAGMLALFAGNVPVGVALGSVTVAPYMITLYALTERVAPPRRAAAAITALGSGGPLGTAVGRAAAGALAQRHGAVGAFLVAPAAAAVALGIAVIVVSVSRLGAASESGRAGRPGSRPGSPPRPAPRPRRTRS